MSKNRWTMRYTDVGNAHYDILRPSKNRTQNLFIYLFISDIYTGWHISPIWWSSMRPCLVIIKQITASTKKIDKYSSIFFLLFTSSEGLYCSISKYIYIIYQKSKMKHMN